MIYLDYSATTPVDDSVLDTFNKVSKGYIGNTNSLHGLGINSRELMDEATKQIATLLNVKSTEIIYTSGSTESNNLAIKGTVSFFEQRGNHIITTRLEHASVKETVKYLENKGCKVSYVRLLPNGTVDIDHLRELINDDTILVSINYVDSEIGLRQPIEEIGIMLSHYKKVLFHVDGTQAVGKIDINLENIDLFSFSAHKFYGIKGIGGLVKKEKVKLEPLFHGGKSTTNYRSGTPTLPLIVSMSKALRLAVEDAQIKYNDVYTLNEKIRKFLLKYKNVTINSNENCIPHVLNISIKGIKPETFIRAMGNHNIFLSTKSACSTDEASEALLTLQTDVEVAKSSIRISISHMTFEEEINKFFEFFDSEYNALNLRSEE